MTADRGSGGPAEPADRRMTATYVWVIVVEVVTLAALWWLQTVFSAG